MITTHVDLYEPDGTHVGTVHRADGRWRPVIHQGDREIVLLPKDTIGDALIAAFEHVNSHTTEPSIPICLDRPGTRTANLHVAFSAEEAGQ